MQWELVSDALHLLADSQFRQKAAERQFRRGLAVDQQQLMQHVPISPCSLMETSLPDHIVSYLGHALLWSSAESCGATTSRVSKPLGHSSDSLTEA